MAQSKPAFFCFAVLGIEYRQRQWIKYHGSSLRKRYACLRKLLCALASSQTISNCMCMFVLYHCRAREGLNTCTVCSVYHSKYQRFIDQPWRSSGVSGRDDAILNPLLTFLLLNRVLQADKMPPRRLIFKSLSRGLEFSGRDDGRELCF